MTKLVHQPDGSARTFIAMAVVFELGLALLGIAIAWAGGLRLDSLLSPGANWPETVIWGLAATVALLPVLASTMFCRWRPIAALRRMVSRFVLRLFVRTTWWQIAAVSLAAGIGEEILFRGAIQPLASSATTPIWGLVIASLLFGAVHAASWSYFWLATLVGFYLGALTLLRGEIVSATIAHALYDFIALSAIARGWFARKRPLFSLRSDQHLERT